PDRPSVCGRRSVPTVCRGRTDRLGRTEVRVPVSPSLVPRGYGSGNRGDRVGRGLPAPFGRTIGDGGNIRSQTSSSRVKAAGLPRSGGNYSNLLWPRSQVRGADCVLLPVGGGFRHEGLAEERGLQAGADGPFGFVNRGVPLSLRRYRLETALE